jgi:hypothetical protein
MQLDSDQFMGNTIYDSCRDAFILALAFAVVIFLIILMVMVVTMVRAKDILALTFVIFVLAVVALTLKEAGL